MNKSDFILNSNVELLWEIIVDTDIVQKNVIYIDKIKEIFNSIINGFYHKEKDSSPNLMSLNKMFISVIINKIKSEIIKDSEKEKEKEKEKEIITFEDLQTERINKFDKEFIKQKNDFDNHNTIKIPTAPKFNDTIDGPLEDMELIIKQTIAKRNFDTEQFNKGANPSSFLKPQETSIKKEKEVQNKTNEIKYIKIDNKELESSIIRNNIIELPNKITSTLNTQEFRDVNKRISWGTNSINYVDDNLLHYNKEPINVTSENIFSKLKKIKTNESDAPIIGEPQNTVELITIEEKFKIINNKIDILTNMMIKFMDTHTN